MLEPSRRLAVNPAHLTDRFQLFVLIVLGESVARLISAAAARPWSVPLAAVLGAALLTLAALWWAWLSTADRAALGTPKAIAWFTALNLPIVTGIAGSSAGLHTAILAADGGGTIGIAPRAALYGGVSLFLLASALLPSGKLSQRARWIRLATSLAAMGLVFMGAIVVPALPGPRPHPDPGRGPDRGGPQTRRPGARLEPSREAGPSRDRLGDVDIARRAFDWIASVAIAADGGLGWPEDGVLSDDLYSGTAGVLLGCAEAEAAGLGTAHVSAGAAAGCCPWPGRAGAWPRCPTTACSLAGLESRWRCAPGRTRPGTPPPRKAPRR